MESVMSRAMVRVVLAAAIVCATATASLAQQTTSSSDTKTFEVLAVEGNQLIVKLPEGTRELTVADDFRFNIDGQSMAVQELRPGMKGTAVITTRTTVTPVTVTEVKNGTVVRSAGGTIIVRTDEGIRSFSQGDVEKRGVKIMLDGRPAQVSDFHEGDQLTATIITSKPPQVLTAKDVQATLEPAPVATSGTHPAPAVTAPAPVEVPAPPPAPEPPPVQDTSVAPSTLPETATSWPALGLFGMLSLGAGLALTLRRRFVR